MAVVLYLGAIYRSSTKQKLNTSSSAEAGLVNSQKIILRTPGNMT